MAVLQLSFFGGYRVTHQVVGDIAFPRRKVLGLLAFLALEAKQAHSRETLMGLLWPELPEEDARNNLRVALARLRTVLDETQMEVSPLVATRNDLRFLLNDDVTLDVDRFRTLLEQTERHTHESRVTCPECQSRLAAAVSLYHGPLLHGFFLDECATFDEWLFVQRERLHLQMMEVLEELAQGLEEQGNFPDATLHTRHQLTLDPLHDSAQRRLLRLLTYQGQTSAALNQYQTFRQVLRDELGVEPDIELAQLAQQIKSYALPMLGTRSVERAVGTPPHNLPENLTPFFGRETELTQLAERLAAPDYRLISLVGPGGIGKTRLAIEAARANLRRYPDGAFFVPLAAIERVENIPTAIADALKFALRDNTRSPQQQLIRYLRGKHLLLVFDNIEHLMDGVDVLLDLLSHCSGVIMLVTSRQQLDVQAEDLFGLHGLPVPNADQIGQADQFAAVRLFCDRAHRLLKTFRLTPGNSADVMTICRLVEGLPLALELAASWIRHYDVDQLARSIAKNIDLLQTAMRDVPPQHRSIRAVFEYSWRLLSPAEQGVLAKLSVFRGGFTDATAVAVAEATPMLITRLRYQSLIRELGHGRYELHELTRQFAAEKLAERGNVVETATWQQHSQAFADLLARHTDALWGPAPRETTLVIQRDIDNVRQAWQWAINHQQWSLLATALQGLRRYILSSGRLREGEGLFAEALKVVSSANDPATDALHINLYIALGGLYARTSQFDEAIRMAQVALEWAVARDDSVRAADAYLTWGYAAQQHDGDNYETIKLHEQGLAWAKRGNDKALMALHLRYISFSQIRINQLAEAEKILKEVLAIQQELGNVMEEQSLWLLLAQIQVSNHDNAAAQPYLVQSLSLLPAVDNPGIEGRVRNALGFNEAALGKFEDALLEHERARHLAIETGEQFQESIVVGNLATVNRKMGKLTIAEAFAQQAMVLARQTESAEAAKYARLHLGYVWLDQEQSQKVISLLSDTLTLPELVSDPPIWGETSAVLAAAHRQLGQFAEALAVIESLIPDLLADVMFSGTDEPFQVYLNTYHTLRDAGDSRADGVLHRAYAHLQTMASKINDPDVRRSFLESVPAHRELVQLRKS